MKTPVKFQLVMKNWRFVNQNLVLECKVARELELESTLGTFLVYLQGRSPKFQRTSSTSVKMQIQNCFVTSKTKNRSWRKSFLSPFIKMLIFCNFRYCNHQCINYNAETLLTGTREGIPRILDIKSRLSRVSNF